LEDYYNAYLDIAKSVNIPIVSASQFVASYRLDKSIGVKLIMAELNARVLGTLKINSDTARTGVEGLVL